MYPFQNSTFLYIYYVVATGHYLCKIWSNGNATLTLAVVSLQLSLHNVKTCSLNEIIQPTYKFKVKQCIFMLISKKLMQCSYCWVNLLLKFTVVETEFTLVGGSTNKTLVSLSVLQDLDLYFSPHNQGSQ